MNESAKTGAKDTCPHGVPFRWPETCDDCACDETPTEDDGV